MANQVSIQTLIHRLRARLRTFSTATGGNVVMTFALATVPMIGFVGSAVDYSRGNSAKAALQSAIDATGLMLSKEAATLTQSQIDQKASAYFHALFTRPEVTNLTLTTAYTTTGGSQVVVTATGQVPTTFMKIMGFSTLNIDANSTVKWGNTRLRVALVLDNTGSMSQSSKLTALKTATKNLLTQLQSAAVTNGDVYVSIIPFVKDVNVDGVNYNQTWVDWTDWDANNGSCSNNNYSTKYSCSVQHSHTWTPANHNTWNGCVTDRGDPIWNVPNNPAPSSQNTDTNVVPPASGNPASQFAAEQYSPCPQAVMPLSYNWSGMTTLVNNMTAGGNTNQAIGLQMGWMSLVGGGVFPPPPAMATGFTYKQVIILLTDGLNTQDRWYTSQTSIDARQQMTCTNAKNAQMIIYTVQVNTGNDPTSNLLRNCATDTGKFFLLTSSNQIVTTFQQIGTELSNLRVAR